MTDHSPDVGCPLSASQEGLLFHSAYEPLLGLYVVQNLYALKGNLNTSAFERAWREVVNRHDSLRSIFFLNDLKQTRRLVRPNIQPLIEIEDWCADPPSQFRDAIETLLLSERQQIDPFSEAPPMRLKLILTAQNTFELIWTYHEVLLDSSAACRVMGEVIAAYEAISLGEPVRLPPAAPYNDYVTWLDQQDASAAEVFWRQELSGVRAPTPLGIDHRRPPSTDETPAFEQQIGRMTNQTTSALQALADKHELQLRTIMQGAWALLLSRYSGQSEVIYGMTIPVLPEDPNLEECALGLRINTLPFRLNVPASERLIPWLKKVEDSSTRLCRYGYAPLVNVHQWSSLPRGQLMFESILQFWNRPEEGVLRTSDGRLEVRPRSTIERGNYPLAVETTLGEALQFRILSHPSRLESPAVARMMGHMCTILEGMAREPERQLDEFSILTEQECHQLLVGWNDTRREYPRDKCLHELFEAQVERTPDHVAVVLEDRSLTYRQLNERANQLAHHLCELGVGPEVPVGICTERSLEMVVGLLGILKAGGAYLPLDPAYPDERLAFLLKDTAAPVVLIQQAVSGRAAQLPARPVSLECKWEKATPEDLRSQGRGTSPENLAYIIYTSGSTGKPKGVMITHLAIVNRLLWMQEAFGLGDGDAVLQKTPFTFDVSVWEFFWPLLTGARLVVAQPDAHKDPAYIAGIIQREHITTLHFVPSMFGAFLNEPTANACTSLKRVFCSGEALLREHVRRFHEILDCELHNLYGPTEAAVDVTWWPCERGGLPPSIPIGRPIANTTTYILDSYLRPVPIGVTGELYIGGIQVGRGYINRDGLTRNSFIPDPFVHVPGARLYKTGDLARYLPDGNIEYLGRLDNQVKVRGFRIELGEIEAVLTEDPGVEQARVLAREDVPGDKRIVAYIVPAKRAPEIHYLKTFLVSKLPAYMIPSTFVFLEKLPLTSSGKGDRRALPSPEPARVGSEESLVPPRTPVEDLLGSIWSDVLGIGKIGVYDNFFDLGGHSLLAVQVVSRIRDAFRIELPLRSLFETPRIADLAAKLDAQKLIGPASGPIVHVDRDGPLRLSFAQERVWFMSQYEPNSPLYNIGWILRLSGTLDIPAFEKSLSEIVRRHEILRTTFRDKDGQPMQIISPAQVMELSRENLRHLPAKSREDILWEISGVETSRLFDLGCGPLLKATLVEMAEDDHAVLLTMHHIISDGWSMSVIFRELQALYTAFLKGLPSPLAELPVQYVDYAAWQRSWMAGEVLENGLMYWRQHLAGLSGEFELPTDHPRPPIETFRGTCQSLRLDRELTGQLKALSRREGMTIFMTLLAAFQTLLYRYSGQEDILIGIPFANRNRSDIEYLIGFFVDTLLLRTDLSGNPTFRELQKRVREVVLGAYTHLDIPFEKLLEELNPQRRPDRSPLFEVMFAYQNYPLPSGKLAELDVCATEVYTGTAKLDLTLFMEEDSEGLNATFEYKTDLFEPGTIRRLLDHLVMVLKGVTADPDLRLSELPLLTEREREKLLCWRGRKVDYPREATLNQIFEAQAERTPDHVAVVFEDRSLTYRQLNERANRLAHYLRKFRIRPDALVGVLMDRSLEMIVALLGILKSGGGYLPLDRAYPEQRLRFMVEDACANLILAQGDCADFLADENRHVIRLDDDWPAIAGLDPENPAPVASAENIAYVNYTSGSTGTPKGVAVPHRAVIRLVINTNYFTVEAADVFLHLSSCAFDATTFEVWGALLNGARCVIMPGQIPTTAELRRVIGQHGVTVLWLTASLFNAIIDEDPAALEGVRQLLTGGEALSVAHVCLGQQRLPNAQIINGYGPTEGTTFSCCYRIPPGLDPDIPSIPIGPPIANSEAYVLDPHGQLLPAGIPGELFIGGDGLARGYLNRPELTAERFVPNPFSVEPCARLYRTGDLVRFLPDGVLEFLGRLDGQVKIHGFRIEPGEIEAVLRAQDTIRQAAVIVREDTPGDKHLVAYIVPAAGAEVSVGMLRDALSLRLPPYMIPASFVFLERLPLTANGKLDRRALPPPDKATMKSMDTYTPPRTPVETKLVKIWSDILGVESVSVRDNFFDLGGHSLKALRVLARIHEAFGLELPVRCLFESQTISKLAVVIEDSGGISETAAPIIPAKRDGEIPQSFGQQGLWFLEQLHPGTAQYNVPLCIRLSGQLNAAVLEDCLNEVIRRHEILRTTFDAVDGRPVQIIHDSSTFVLRIDDLQGLPELQRSSEAQSRIVEEVRLPFDLVSGPLLRARLLRLKEQEHILILIIHHIVCDGWSFRILFDELAALYQARFAVLLNPLPELPIQYADFAYWQGQRLQEDLIEPQLSYWKQLMAGVPTVLRLPSDRKAPAGPAHAGATRSIQLPRVLLEGLQALSRQEGVSLFMTILAAFQTLLWKYTGFEKIVVGCPLAGRTILQVERLIGYFVNTLPFPANLAGDSSFLELLTTTRELTLGAYAHQDLPLERLVKELHPERDPGSTPLFQVVLAFENFPDWGLNVPGLTADFTEVDTGTAKFDLTLIVKEHNDGLRLSMEYRTVLFEPVTIDWMLCAFQTLLEGVLKDPNQRLTKLARHIPTRRQGTAKSQVHPRHVDNFEESEPLTDVEKTLAGMWSELLRRPNVGLNQDFFDLGGDSLLAIRLFSRVEKNFGVTLPLSTLFESATVATLAGVIESRLCRDSDSSLWTIRTGFEGPSLYILPSLGGELMFCRELIAELGPEQMVQGFHTPGHDTDRKSFATIEAMAQYFAEYLLRFQPVGPYCLLGYSFGGTVAYELARQLSAAGREVALLALIDASTFPVTEGWDLSECLGGISGFFRNLPFWVWGEIFKNNPRGIAKHFARGSKRIARRLRALAAFRFQASVVEDLDEIFDVSMLSQPYRDIMQTHLRAYREYRAQPYRGRVTLFRARIRPLTHSLRYDLGWSRMALGGVDIRVIPCNHDNIMRKPHVLAISRQIRNLLADVRQQCGIANNGAAANLDTEA